MPIEFRNDITADRLRALLYYDPLTGIFTRLSQQGRWPAGESVGTFMRGYINIGVDSKRYKAHRLAWLYMIGEWPIEQIDHINGVKYDNRFANLRLATCSTNAANQKTRMDSSSGVKGVWFDPKRNRWRAAIRQNGKTIHLGSFASSATAHEAYIEKAKELFGQYARAA